MTNIACAEWRCLRCTHEWFANVKEECPQCQSPDVQMIAHDEQYDDHSDDGWHTDDEPDDELPW